MAPALRGPTTRAAAAVVLLAGLADAMKTSGSALVRANSTVFIAKFCFTFNPQVQEAAGVLKLRLRAPAASIQHRAHMVLFDDEADSYPGPSSAWNALTCEQRMQHGRNYETIDQTLISQDNGQQIIFMIRQKLRPRWWYVALSDCSNEDLAVEYEVSAENPAYGWASEFSTDKRFGLYIFGLLAVVYGGLAAAQAHANAVLAESAHADSARGKAAHPFARILTAGITLALLETAASMLYNVRYVYNGYGIPFAYILAQLFAVSSNFVLASLLLLISEGKCVSYIMVVADARRMLRLLGPFLVSCFVLECWGEYSLSRNYSTDYVYTSVFGWALIMVDLVLLGLYFNNLHRTHEAERGREDGVFYRTWGVVYGAWFLALPITAILAQAVLAPYTWYVVSLSVKKGVTALMYGALVVGLWPGNKRTYFKLETAALPAVCGHVKDNKEFTGLLGRFAGVHAEFEVYRNLKQGLALSP